MRPLTYPIIAFIFNYILYHSFHWGEGGTGLGILIIFPVIAIFSLLLTLIHYVLGRVKYKTFLFQIVGSIATILLSYYLFISQDTPLSVIDKMIETRQNINSITINDYFRENNYENYEKIVAAKKKFALRLSDTAYSVNISNYIDHTQLFKTYGILFFTDKPTITDSNQTIERVGVDSFLFTEYFMGDTLLYSGNKKGITIVKQPRDSFSGRIYKDVTIEPVIKSQTPDNKLWAYKVYYWLL